ncbi:MAG: P1 family peptidase [Dehalococcoidia bacterium]|uniref:P1 family peptidase n=1 Tax=Candidatus Amarobacter glycogenicus TaxID=3140699 RepID=UPI0031352373|nr:P1 family peptidase [Dehalococcoidia bacterium]MBK9344131.1 P1 family peptidase [Dehalococcoidia bacterium]
MTAWQTGPRNAITDVPGIRVGHSTDRRNATGCTVILCESSTAAAVDTRGGAPGTRETDVLGLSNLVRKCHAVLFTGGSAFGLAAADGVMRWLGEKGAGFPTAHRAIPIVSAAVLYDLGLGNPLASPAAEDGYRAASRAKGGAVAEGSVGAGTGATVAKLLGAEHALKGGLGTASLLGPNGIVVGALVATNAVGSLVDPDTGKLVAGPRGTKGRFLPLPEALARRTEALELTPGENTTLICVATNAKLEPHQLQRICTQAHDGFARVVVPAHTIGDGDIAFAVSMGTLEIPANDVLTVGALAARTVEAALLRSVMLAAGMKDMPSAADWRRR